MEFSFLKSFFNINAPVSNKNKGTPNLLIVNAIILNNCDFVLKLLCLNYSNLI